MTVETLYFLIKVIYHDMPQITINDYDFVEKYDRNTYKIFVTGLLASRIIRFSNGRHGTRPFYRDLFKLKRMV